MKNWKKNGIMVAVLVFVCAGIYLNWRYTSDGQATNLADTLNAEKILNESTLVMSPSALEQTAGEDLVPVDGTSTDYFATVRLSRQQSRDSAINLLQEAMAYGDEDGTSTANAELEELVSVALSEAQIESLVIAKGYADCVAYMSDNGVSLAVAAPEEGLSETDIALLSDIVLSQGDYTLEDLTIIEVKS